MNRWGIFIFSFLGLSLAQAASTPAGDISFAPRIGTELSSSLVLNNEQGRPVTIPSLLRGKPALLIPVYFECPMLCTFTLNNLLSSIRAMSPTTGRDFQLIVFSIDPNETPDLAKGKRDTYLKAYRRPEGTDGWHFLTGTSEELSRLTDAIGFRYAKDPKHDAFAHAAGIVVVTPEGKISRFLPGVDFEPKTIREALKEAGQGRLGRLFSTAVMLCYRYDPSHARYTLSILSLLRTAAILSALLLIGGIYYLVRVDRS